MSSELRYFVLHKPFGILSQFTPEGGHQSLADLDFTFPKDVYPVGRLDQDSEGLLILTNDNYLKNNLLDPKSEKLKTYLVQVEGEINDEALRRLEEGVSVKHKGKVYHTRPAEASHFSGIIPEEREPPVRFRKSVPTSWLTLTIIEGKNRQVRKMTAAVGFPTLRLIRLGIQNMKLNELAIGEVQEVLKTDIYQQCGIKP